MGELGRYPLFLEVLLNMIKYWVRLSKINTSSTLLSEFLLLSEAQHKQNKKSWYASIDTIRNYLNVSAKSILTTKRNIKSYFYLNLNLNIMQFGKLIFLMTDLESNMEINCAHIDFSKIILHLNLVLI
jgi:hypothetical protein